MLKIMTAALQLAPFKLVSAALANLLSASLLKTKFWHFTVRKWKVLSATQSLLASNLILPQTPSPSPTFPGITSSPLPTTQSFSSTLLCSNTKPEFFQFPTSSWTTFKIKPLFLMQTSQLWLQILPFSTRHQLLQLSSQSIPTHKPWWFAVTVTICKATRFAVTKFAETAFFLNSHVMMATWLTEMDATQLAAFSLTMYVWMERPTPLLFVAIMAVSV